MANFGFNVSETDYSDRGDFTPMPKGEYSLKATEAELKDTANKDGKYLATTFEVVKPAEFAGRKIWQNFNIFNPSEKAEKIGREQVAGWAKACGRPNAKDSDELLERTFACKLDIEKGSGGYSDRNKIGSFLMPGQEGKSSGSAGPATSKGKFDEESASASTKKEDPKIEAPDPAPSAGKKKNPWD